MLLDSEKSSSCRSLAPRRKLITCRTTIDRINHFVEQKRFQKLNVLQLLSLDSFFKDSKDF